MKKHSDHEQRIAEEIEKQRITIPDFSEIMNGEDAVREKTDQHGNKWKKVYTGGGSHFTNCFDQYKEIYGEENIMVEECDTAVGKCYTESNEKMKRIWVKK